MKLMAWSHHFETGIQSVDAQHHALVDMINGVAQNLASEGVEAKQLVMPLLEKLIQYAARHFKHEEDLMAQFALSPEYAAHHHSTHQIFVAEVLHMRSQFEQSGSVSGNDLLRFLTSWLSFHILSEDKRMALQIQAVQGGQSAEKAYVGISAEGDSSHAVYTDALIDLFTLLTERNRSLTQVNEQVRAAQADLEAVNRTLESRVAKRTQELLASNAALQTEHTALLESMSRLERTQGQLLQSEKMAAVGQLAAGVAHEINNPIGFVSSNMGSLANYVGQLFEAIEVTQQLMHQLPAAQREAIEHVLKKIDIDYLRQDIPELLRESKEGLLRVKGIVSDLRDFSHIDEGKWLPTDLNRALESALNMASNEIKYKAEVEKYLSELPSVLCIPSQINQVFVNLLVNAAQAMQSQGKITLRTGVAQANIWVEISDSGCGMPADVQKRIFEPFYTTKPVGKGTGLGLSITWEIIQRHHGQIEVRSQPGEGTTFRITLPQQQPA